MPREAIECGAAQIVSPLDQIPDRIIAFATGELHPLTLRTDDSLGSRSVPPAIVRTDNTLPMPPKMRRAGPNEPARIKQIEKVGSGLDYADLRDYQSTAPLQHPQKEKGFGSIFSKTVFIDP